MTDKKLTFCPKKKCNLFEINKSIYEHGVMAIHNIKHTRYLLYTFANFPEILVLPQKKSWPRPTDKTIKIRTSADLYSPFSEPDVLNITWMDYEMVLIVLN